MSTLELINQKKYSLKTFEQLQFKNLDNVTQADALKFFNRVFTNKDPFFLSFTLKTIQVTNDDREAVKFVCDKIFNIIQMNRNDYIKLSLFVKKLSSHDVFNYDMTILKSFYDSDNIKFNGRKMWFWHSYCTCIDIIMDTYNSGIIEQPVNNNLDELDEELTTPEQHDFINVCESQDIDVILETLFSLKNKNQVPTIKILTSLLENTNLTDKQIEGLMEMCIEAGLKFTYNDLKYKIDNEYAHFNEIIKTHLERNNILSMDQYTDLFGDIPNSMQNLTFDVFFKYITNKKRCNDDLISTTFTNNILNKTIINHDDKIAIDFNHKMNILIETSIDLHSLPLFEFLIKNEAVIEQKHMELIFTKTTVILSLEKILLAMFNNKLHVSKECFYKFIDNFNKYGFTTFQTQHMINLLIYCGLNIDLDCIGYALKHRFVLEKLETYGLDYDDNLYNICVKCNIYPESYLIEFDKKIGVQKMTLRELFAFSSLHMILKYINFNNIDFQNNIDVSCIKMCIKYNPNAIEILKHFGQVPSLFDIIEIIDESIRREMFNTFFNTTQNTIQNTT